MMNFPAQMFYIQVTNHVWEYIDETNVKQLWKTTTC